MSWELVAVFYISMFVAIAGGTAIALALGLDYTKREARTVLALSPVWPVILAFPVWWGLRKLWKKVRL